MTFLSARRLRTPLAARALGSAAVAVVLVIGAPDAGARPQVGLMDPAYAASQPERYWRTCRPAAGVPALRGALERDRADEADGAARPGRPGVPLGLPGRRRARGRRHGYAGCDLIATVWRTPRWASAVKRPLQLREHAGRARSSATSSRRSATRYSGSYDPDGAGPLETLPQIACWEIWNEPNFNGALRPQRKNGVLLGGQLREAAQRRLRGDQGRRQALQLQEPGHRRRALPAAQRQGHRADRLHGGDEGPRREVRRPVDPPVQRHPEPRHPRRRRRRHALAEHRHRQLRPLPDARSTGSGAASASRSGSRSTAGRRRPASTTSTPSPRRSRRRS